MHCLLHVVYSEIQQDQLCTGYVEITQNVLVEFEYESEQGGEYVSFYLDHEFEYELGSCCVCICMSV
jgi:hypothetical protein